MHEADPERAERRADLVAVILLRMRMRMEVEVAVPPANQQANGEEDDERGDRGLRSLLDALGDVALGEQDRDAEDDERDRVTGSPPRAEPRRRPGRALAARRDERRHRGDVIRVGRVAEAEKRSDEEDDGDGAPSENPASQSSMPNTSLFRPPSRIGSRSPNPEYSQRRSK